MKKYILIFATVFSVGASTYTITQLTENNSPSDASLIEIYDPTATPKSGKLLLTNLVTKSAITNALGLTGSTSTYLRSDGTQDTPPGGSGGTTNMMVSTIASGTTLSPTFAIPGLSTTAASCRRVTFRLELSGNVTTINAPGGTLIDGDTMVWEVIQDATGSRTVSGWDGKYAFGSDLPQSALILSTGAAKRDFITFAYNFSTDKWYCVGFIRGF